jgi:polysaccharide pyruvyl transferase WcaK-like protein
MAHHRRRIGIMGTCVSSGNRGVLALGVSLVRLCGEADIVLLLNHNEHRPALFKVDGEVREIPVVPCRLSPRSRPRDHLAWILAMALLYRLVPVAGVRRAIAGTTPWIRAVAEADVVGDVRGGDSFSDIYGMKRFLLGFVMAWTVLLVKGEMVQFPQTYGPFKSGLARRLARYLLVRSSVVIARDERSQRVAQELMGEGREVLLSPDVAFSLEATVPERVGIEPPTTRSATERIIGLNVNGLMYHGGYTRDNMFGLKLDYPRFLSECVTALLREAAGEIWLMPHTYAATGDVESDLDASRRLREGLPVELQARVRIVATEYDQHEIKGVIGGCDFFIGSRMHACIAALSQGVPCVGVAYSMKFGGVFDSVGMGEWVIDGREVESGQAIARVLQLYRRRNEVRESLGRQADEARARLRVVFQRIFTRQVAGRLCEAPEPSHRGGLQRAL